MSEKSGGGFGPPRVVSQSEWLAARKRLLEKEKALTHQRDAVSAERRRLPMVRIGKDYRFETSAGTRTLVQLFDGRSQLVVYHFMFAPGWEQGCPSCSFLADHFDGAVVHLAQRDVTFVVASRATLPEILAFKRRMGWRFEWVSSNGSDFNYDYHVSVTEEQMGRKEYNFGELELDYEELPGASVFYRNADGEVFHTYSTYARGLDPFVGVYQWLDLVPKGRDEDRLDWPMQWVRHHDRY
jgi:predicted dithiol-disulfide oxidoreductase (DUF899 family)